MSEPEPREPFFLIVTDHERNVFSVEGPMTDDRPWQAAARWARDHHQHHITCGPSGPDCDALAADFGRMRKLTGAPPGSIVSPRRSG
jgi:hypothetical protein